MKPRTLCLCLSLLCSCLGSTLTISDTEIHSQNIGDGPHAVDVAIIKCKAGKPLPVDWNSGMAEAVDLLLKHRMQSY